MPSLSHRTVPHTLLLGALTLPLAPGQEAVPPLAPSPPPTATAVLLPAAPAAAADVLVVTAAGTEQTVLETPAAVNTVSSERAARNKAGWLGETLNQVPGVYYAQLRGSTDAPAIRLPLNYANYYLYLEDDVPLQPTLSYNHSAFQYSGALTSDGGIEILKGPGTALYGSDALAAVINVKSRAPTDTPSGRLRIGGGSYGARSVIGEVSDGLTDTQSGRLAVSYSGEDGWRDHTAWDRLQGIARHRYQAGETRVDTILIATRVTAQMSGYLDRETLDHDPSDSGLQAGVPIADAKEEATYLRLSSALRTPLGAGARLEVTPYVRAIDDSYMEVWNPDTTPIDTDRTLTVGSLDRVRLAVWTGGEVVLGGDVEYTREHFVAEQTRPTSGVFGLTSFQGKHYDYDVGYLNLAPYLQVSQDLGEQWILNAGVRYDWTSYAYAENLGPTTDPLDFVYRPPSRTDRFHQTSPKAGATYLLDQDDSLFARYAHGFRIPSSASLYALANGQDAFTLHPEQFDSYELGYKGRADTFADWELDTYWVESHDGIIDGVVTSAGTISANGGRRRYRGAELGGNLRPGGGVEIGLSYSHSFNEILRYRAEGPSPEDGKKPANAPENLADLRVGYRPVADWLVEVETQWLGSWYMDDLNTKRTPEVVLVNLRSSYQLSRTWSIDAKVLNVFDKRYAATAESFSYGDFFRPGAPLTAAVGAEASF